MSALHTCRGANKTKIKTRSSTANINLTKLQIRMHNEQVVRSLVLAPQTKTSNASQLNHNNTKTAYASMLRSQTSVSYTGCLESRSNKTVPPISSTSPSMPTLTPSCTTITSRTSSPSPCPWTCKSALPASSHCQL